LKSRDHAVEYARRQELKQLRELAKQGEDRVEQYEEVTALAASRREVRTLEAEMAALKQKYHLVDSLFKQDTHPPKWLQVKRGAKDVVTLGIVLSDLHLDEEIAPEQVLGANKFNRQIAEQRLRKLLTRVIRVARDYVAGVDIDGVVVFAVGDNISGNIHQELRETNHGTVMESVVHWTPLEAAFIEGLADEFKKVHVICTPGNHDRNSMKPVMKNRSQDSFDWIIFHWMKSLFAGDKRITWDISAAADARIEIGGATFLATHGDQFRGGSGIAGMLSPLMIGVNRKTRRETRLGFGFDWMVMGHWHQYWVGKGLIVNSALKGYDEYAFINNFEPEPPSQTLFVVNHTFGVTAGYPIFVCDREEEGW